MKVYPFCKNLPANPTAPVGARAGALLEGCRRVSLVNSEQQGVYETISDVPYGVRPRNDVPITVQNSRMYASGGKIASLITFIACPVD